MILDAVLDALKDGALSIPVLFLAYLLMELLERSQKLNEAVLHRKSRLAGPAVGGLLGIVPQCGISGAAATLFSTGTVSVGTMLAVFFATSDEMLPLLLANTGTGAGRIMKILLLKVAIAVVLGYVADLLFLRRINAEKSIHGFCEQENCACEEEEGSVFTAALVHTLKIAVLLVAVSAVLNLLLAGIGAERLAGSVLNQPIIGEALLAVFGLIPNCSVSVILTEGYLSGIIGIGGLFAGLLSNAGIGLMVLLRSNRNRKENLWIICFMAGAAFAAGALLTLLGVRL